MISMHTNSSRPFLVVAVQLHSLSNFILLATARLWSIVELNKSNVLHVDRIYCMIYPYAVTFTTSLPLCDIPY